MSKISGLRTEATHAMLMDEKTDMFHNPATDLHPVHHTLRHSMATVLGAAVLGLLIANVVMIIRCKTDKTKSPIDVVDYVFAGVTLLSAADYAWITYRLTRDARGHMGTVLKSLLHAIGGMLATLFLFGILLADGLTLGKCRGRSNTNNLLVVMNYTAIGIATFVILSNSYFLYRRE